MKKIFLLIILLGLSQITEAKLVASLKGEILEADGLVRGKVTSDCRLIISQVYLGSFEKDQKIQIPEQTCQENFKNKVNHLEGFEFLLVLGLGVIKNFYCDESSCKISQEYHFDPSSSRILSNDGAVLYFPFHSQLGEHPSEDYDTASPNTRLLEQRIEESLKERHLLDEARAEKNQTRRLRKLENLLTKYLDEEKQHKVEGAYPQYKDPENYNRWIDASWMKGILLDAITVEGELGKKTLQNLMENKNNNLNEEQRSNIKQWLN